ncbi:MAG TPA: amino acid adenylation domain-containing protein [Bacillota bacterium]|nr:amino acid adenylation domain-containing protein [Bacillota bacterium]
MIPSYFIELEKLPLTSNGKVDRRRLPEPAGRIKTKVLYVAPRNQMEMTLAGIWREVLGIEKIGIHDNFFESGGHSLKATVLMSKVHKTFNLELPLLEIFNRPTIREQAEYLNGAVESIYVSIQPVSVLEGYPEGYYPLSSAQKRLYILSGLDGAGTNYNMPGATIIEGQLERATVETAFIKLVGRHESLRTSFELLNGEPVQRIYEAVDFQIEYAGEDSNPRVLADDGVRATGQSPVWDPSAIMRDFIRPFNLKQAPLLRVKLVKMAPDEHLLLYDMHHIISDGVSINILLQEFIGLYESQPLPPLRIQYKDYAVWQNERIRSGEIKMQETYWVQTFSGEIPVLNLPTDYPRPAVQSFEGDRIGFEIDADLSRRINQLAAESGATVFMIILAAFNILLFKYTGQEEIIIGSPIAGRPHTDLEKLIGMFVNTLALRNFPMGAKSFTGFLAEVKANSLAAYENQDYQFEELVEKVNVRRDLSRNPLFDVMFVLQNTEMTTQEIHDLRFRPYQMENHTAKFDLTCAAVEIGAGIYFTFEYCAKLFKRETVTRFAGHFTNILQAITAHREITLAEIEILDETERQRLLVDFNQTQVTYPEIMIHEMFAIQAQKTPEQIALVFQDQSLTYRELNEKANQLARVLWNKGIKPGTLVAIMMKRSVEMIISILGILKAGGAYLPVDSSYPLDRINYLLNDSNPAILLTDASMAPKMTFTQAVVQVHLDELTGEVPELPKVNEPGDLAYIIYTSGSTGVPKGVMVEHRGIANTILWRAHEYQFTVLDQVLQLFSHSFDGFLTSFFAPVVSGATIVMPNDEEAKNPVIIKEYLVSHKITHFICVPALYYSLLEIAKPGELRNLRMITLAGDKIDEGLVTQSKRLNPNLEVINEYGPTENSVASTYFRDLHPGETVSIGKPIANSQVYIVDQAQKLQPIGVFGEIWVSGPGLARGYLNNPELTEEKFFVRAAPPQEEIRETPVQRIYRTGDLARRLPDGNLEFLGRIDHQVKIRGFRIELGEIEARLLQHEAIQQAIVIAKENKNEVTAAGRCAFLEGGASGGGDKYLGAYFVSSEKLTGAQLRNFLLGKLPDYMIPSCFIRLAEMPLTENGKINLKALPEPEPGTVIDTGTEYVEPRSEIEATLVEVWQEVLGNRKIGINDNFYSIGGDSLKAIRVLAVLHKYGFTFEMRDFLREPVIGGLAGYVKKLEVKEEQEIIQGEIGLLQTQKRFFSRNYTEMNYWNGGLVLYRKSGFDEAIVKKVFDRLVEYHDALRILFKFEGEQIIQYIRGIEADLYEFEVIDLRGATNYEVKIKEENRKAQASLDLSKGPLVKIVLYKTDEGDHLLWVIHHLILDGVSVREIMEDFRIGYEQVQNGAEIRLQPKTDSLREWSQRIAEYAQSKELLAELGYWLQLEEAVLPPLPKDAMAKSNTIIDGRSITQNLLTLEETEKLLQLAKMSDGIEIKTASLTAFGLAIAKWAGQNKVMIYLASHGREPIFEGLDVSRTAGWFSNYYPVFLELNPAADIYAEAKQTQQMLNAVPNNGFGYEILRYLTFPKSNQFKLWPEISFNYSGNLSGDGGGETPPADFGDDLITDSRIFPGLTMSPNSVRDFTFTLDSGILGGVLYFRFHYNRLEYKADTIMGIIKSYRENLLKIIESS